MDDDFLFYHHVDVAQQQNESELVLWQTNLGPYTNVMGQPGITRNPKGEYFLDVAINNPNGKRLRMLWDTGTVGNSVSIDVIDTMGIKIPANAVPKVSAGFAGGQVQEKTFPVTFYMPFTTPLQTNIDVGGHDNIIDTPTVLARYNIHLTSAGIQFTPRDKSGATAAAPPVAPAAVTAGPVVPDVAPTTSPSSPPSLPLVTHDVLGELRTKLDSLTQGGGSQIQNIWNNLTTGINDNDKMVIAFGGVIFIAALLISK